MDAARAAIRLRAKEVHLVCLESRDLTCKDGMLADASEIEQAEGEGLIIHPCMGLSKVLTKNKKFCGIEAVTCSSVRERDGTFSPKYDRSSPKIIDGDTLIIAIGQKPAVSGFGEIEKTNQGTIKSNPFSLETSMRGVFAGGDAVSGPIDVISAIAAGKDAAISIDRYLHGLDLCEGRPPTAIKTRQILPVREIGRTRSTMPVLNPDQRVKSFNEVALGFDERKAVDEAQICFTCGICKVKLDAGLKPACAASCSARCIHFDTSPD